MNIEKLAFSVVQKEIQSKIEISLGNISCKEINVVPNPVFIDKSGNYGTCLTRKFKTIDSINDKLENLSLVNDIFVYKLYELSEYGKDLEPTGNKLYHLRYAVRSKK